VSALTNLTQVAIAGVDLLLDSDLKATIVEINNNPAMPGESKNMSSRYKQHLIDFVGDIFQLGVGRVSETKFDLLW
jgi:D-alanine-D-alanine ligase-like ATP-grasp enzyme